MERKSIDILKIDGRRWVTIAEAAAEVGRPEITVYKAREADRLPSRKVYGRLVVDLDAAIKLWPTRESEHEEELEQ